MERPLHRNREYVALWVGQTVSALGISISSFAHPLVVLAATGSPAKAGLVGSVLARHDVLPASARRRAHRPLEQEGDPRRVRRRARAVRGRVVAPPQVRDAIARNQSRMQLAGLVGPPLGGVLLGVGRALPFVADAVSYLVSLVGVLFVRSSLLDPPARRSKRRIAGEVLDGVRWLWRRPFFRGVLVWMTLEGAAFSSIGLVILVLARERGATSAQLGAMFAITSGGGVLGALAAPWFLRHASVRSARRRSSCHRRWAGSSSRRSRSSARTSCWDAPTARRSSSRASPRRSGR